jgi:hypothetical protein
LWGIDLGHCVDGSRWFFGSRAIFFHWVDFEHGVGIFGWFLGFFFMGVDSGHCLGGFWGVRTFCFMGH